MKTCFVVQDHDVYGILRSASVTGRHIIEEKQLYGMLNKIREDGFFAERSKMETMPQFKQIIPGVILRDFDKNQIVLYQRKPSHTESRLAGLWTPIFGGHIDAEDTKKAFTGIHQYLPELFENALGRELLEETGINYNRDNLSFDCFIYDESNAVGRVHLGLLFQYDVEINNNLIKQIVAQPEVNDVLIVDIESLSDLNNSEYVLEGWAQIALSNMAEIESVRHG